MQLKGYIDSEGFVNVKIKPVSYLTDLPKDNRKVIIGYNEKYDQWVLVAISD